MTLGGSLLRSREKFTAAPTRCPTATSAFAFGLSRAATPTVTRSSERFGFRSPVKYLVKR